MNPITSDIQAIDMARDAEVNLSGVAQVLSLYSGSEGDCVAAMLSFVVDGQVEKIRNVADWLETSFEQSRS